MGRAVLLIAVPLASSCSSSGSNCANAPVTGEIRVRSLEEPQRRLYPSPARTGWVGALMSSGARFGALAEVDPRGDADRVFRSPSWHCLKALP
jgi:hypothetical protein